MDEANQLQVRRLHLGPIDANGTEEQRGVEVHADALELPHNRVRVLIVQHAREHAPLRDVLQVPKARGVLSMEALDESANYVINVLGPPSSVLQPYGGTVLSCLHHGLSDA